MRQYQKHLREKAIAAVINHEIAMLQESKSRQGDKIQRYFNSSVTREAFAKIMVHARLSDTDYSISEIARLLSISRVAVIQMVNDTEAEGWIVTRPGARKSRLCRADPSLLVAAEDWFDMYKRNASKTGYITYFRLLESLEEAIELEETQDLQSL